VSVRVIAQDGLAGRLRHRLGASRSTARPAVFPIRISISSMRALETSVALGAIATALLIGLGR
jgi:hypothetical protein